MRFFKKAVSAPIPVLSVKNTQTRFAESHLTIPRFPSDRIVSELHNCPNRMDSPETTLITLTKRLLCVTITKSARFTVGRTAFLKTEQNTGMLKNT